MPATTYYVRTTGNDTTGEGTALLPWLTIAKALAVPPASGDTINIGAGTFDEVYGRVVLPNGVNAVGAGAASIVLSEGDNPLVTLKPDSGSDVSLLTVNDTAEGTGNVVGAASNQAAFTAAVIHDCSFGGNGNVFAAVIAGACSGTFTDCVFAGRFDCAVVSTGAHEFTFTTCTMNARGVSADDDTTRCVVGLSATAAVTIDACSLSALGPADVIAAIDWRLGTLTVTNANSVVGGTFISGGTVNGTGTLATDTLTVTGGALTAAWRATGVVSFAGGTTLALADKYVMVGTIDGAGATATATVARLQGGTVQNVTMTSGKLHCFGSVNGGGNDANVDFDQHAPPGSMSMMGVGI